MTSASREKILSTITNTLSIKAPMPYPEVENNTAFYNHPTTPLDELFAEEFIKLGGKFVYCTHEIEFAQKLHSLIDNNDWKKVYIKDSSILKITNDLALPHITDTGIMDDMDVSVTLCEYAIARTGSILLSSAQQYGRALPVYTPIHIAVVYASQIVWNIEEGIEKIKQKYPQQLPSMISLTTGPSRTADIEKTLVVGVHGPKEVYVFLIDKP